jgi:ribosome-binding protein aMBF1 (putative translation factor)
MMDSIKKGRMRNPRFEKTKYERRLRKSQRPMAEAIGARVKEARIRSGMSTMDLAIKSEVHLGTVHNLECGRTMPDIETLVAIAHALGVTVSRLVGES